MTKQNRETPTKESSFIRPPVVTIMGHVDHGKTSLLDYIRKTKVAEKEAGGITQSVGAYQAEYNGKKITFIDTPGHAAFTSMRTRGGKAADIVVLVVSAEDGVMPQTKEAISIVQFTKSPMIVAINKIDLPGSNSQRVKQQLSENNVLVEDWGGEIISVEVSAKTGSGVDTLLKSILTLAEILELKADPSSDLEGVIIESRLDPKKGPVFTGLVKGGTLRVGDQIFTAGIEGRVKSLIGYTGTPIKEALPSDPVEVLGFPSVPKVGESFVGAKNKEILLPSVEQQEAETEYGEGDKVVNIILKADSLGTLEALEGAVKSITVPGARIKILLKATGDITESDVHLASTSDALIFGFNARLTSKVSDLADSFKVVIRTYKIIYELLDNLEEVLKQAAFKEEIKVKGRAVVQQIFPLPSGDVVAGVKVLGGALKNTSRVAVLRPGEAEPLYTGKIKTLKRGKDDVNVVGRDVECGVLLKPAFPELKSGDVLEVL